MVCGPYRRDRSGRLCDGVGGGDGVGNQRRIPADYVRKQCHCDECGGRCDRAVMGRRGGCINNDERPNRLYVHGKRVIRVEETFDGNTDGNDIWTLERDCVDGVFVDCDIGCWFFAPGEHDGPYRGDGVE